MAGATAATIVRQAEQVRSFFDGEAERFQAIYSREKALSQRLVDFLFHRVVHQRFQLTLDLCGPVAGKKILDIGCGPGHYCVEFARRGAEVVGLDFAPVMVEKARSAAVDAGVEERCVFEVCDFLQWRQPHHFDICLAIGFFDYISDPAAFLRKICTLTRDQLVMSFPKRWTSRTFSRWLRLRMRGCPVFFYSETDVASLLKPADWSRLDVHRLSRDFLVHGRAKG